jgi:nicotinamidase-related amidase
MTPLPIPRHFDPATVGQVWRVPYAERAAQAREWAARHSIPPASADSHRVCLLLVDVQNTFCIPGHELFVAGRSGQGAVDDNRRLCGFIYRNLASITAVAATLDTHGPLQIFHPAFWVDAQGRHPEPYTVVTPADVESGRWRPAPRLAAEVGLPDAAELRAYALHYTRELERRGKYALTIWPYHALLGGIGHALVAAVEEAVFFHSLARATPPRFEVKGDHPLTEHYSVLRAEVSTDHHGRTIAAKNDGFIQRLLDYDAVVLAGQAKSHCVAWTIDDLLTEIAARDPRLARKVWLLEDCTSPVVVPGVVDYTDQADAAFQRFTAAGMRLIRSDADLTTFGGRQGDGS